MLQILFSIFSVTHIRGTAICEALESRDPRRSHRRLRLSLWDSVAVELPLPTITMSPVPDDITLYAIGGHVWQTLRMRLSMVTLLSYLIRSPFATAFLSFFPTNHYQLFECC